ncbi:hypothetical protein [Caenispirillum salinarum]|uniref:hypothetical protein n=1 Tax=Caenispirillum salinarum TaxID=859058 RepID=UPI00384FDBDF
MTVHGSSRPAATQARVLVLGCVAGVVILLAVTWPLWLAGAVPGWDRVPHSIWYLSLKEQLALGDPYPRWLVNGNAGLGSPALYFYGFVPVSVAAATGTALEAVGLHRAPLHGLAVAATLFSLAGFLGMVVLMRRRVGAVAALIAGLVLVLHPFAFAFDLFQRFGFAEHAAIMTLPWLAAAVLGVLDGRRHAVLMLVVVAAVLVTTHLPSAAIAAAVTGAAALALVLMRPKGRRAGVLARLVLAAVLALALAAPYLATVLTQAAWVSVDALVDQEVFDYRRNFVFTGPHRTAREVTAWAVIPSLVVIVAGIAVSLWRLRAMADGARQLLVLGSATALASLFLMTEASAPLWATIEPLQMIQFPWRVVVGLTLATAVLAGLLVDVVAERPKGVVSAGLVTVIAAAGATALPAVERTAWLYVSVWRQGADAFPISDLIDLRQDMREYRPAWADPALLSPKSLDAVRSRQAEGEPAGPVRVAIGPDRITATGTVGQPTCFLLDHLYYPVWGLGGAARGGATRFGPGPDGRMQVCVPPGPFAVRIERRMTPAELLGMALAISAALTMAGFALSGRRRFQAGAGPVRPNMAPERTSGG